MSPTYQAALARRVLFELEALEPRRFLSGDVAVAESIPGSDEAPNDIQSATPWDIAMPLHGALSEVDRNASEYTFDEDYYRFEASAGDSFIFNQTGGFNVDIFDSDRELRSQAPLKWK